MIDLEVAKISGAYLVGCFVLHGIIHAFSKLTLPNVFDGFEPSAKVLDKVDPDKRQKFQAGFLFNAQVNWTMNVLSMLYSALLFGFNLHVVYSFHGTDEMFDGVSFYSMHSIVLHLAVCVYESCTYLATGKDIVFYLHHIVVIGNALPILLTGRMHYYYCSVGLVEGTNVPLCCLTLLGQIPSMKGGAAYAASGAALWITYVPIRVILPGVVFYSLYGHLHSHPESTWVYEDKTWNNAWLAYYLITGVFLWGLSLYWFSLITKGLLKALGFNKPKLEKVE